MAFRWPQPDQPGPRDLPGYEELGHQGHPAELLRVGLVVVMLLPGQDVRALVTEG
ncbi:hypothetical protein [Nocardia mangyaensis]|uniref:hypothetical protein n=1 Tax=Nocardia mangyaensis TaxID=2213200 RepID=UPI0026775DCA|nr:hypothetical protein [Nocardia mangyaensis]MDO3645872.1 hypothetical protein [Nocardia mangyaensis]